MGTSLQFPHILRELRTDILSARAVAALSAGVTSGLGLLVAQVAFATLIFSGPLAPYTSQGVGLILFGNFAACLLIALGSSYRGAIGGLSPALVIGMAVIGASMSAEGDALFVTASGALILSAALIGVSCLLIGRFRLANLLRFVPYPVSAGFVAGSGGAVCLSAVSLMGVTPGWQEIPAMLEPAALWRWAPGAAYGIALYAAVKRWGNPLILPVSFVLAVGAYHLALARLGISGAQAQATGLLLTSTVDGNLWPVLGASDIARLDWAAMAGQVPNMLALMLVAFICVIMNIAGLEAAANRDLDWDREFNSCGLASLVAGLGGGTVATIVVPSSLRSKLLGAATRLTGILAALVIGGALVVGDGMLELVPSSLVGGILIFAGLGMLDEGLVRTNRRLPRSEFAIVVLIFVVILALGLLEGVGAGILATLVFFTVRLSRVDTIESRFTALDRRSNRVRSVPERTILLNEGDRVHAYCLRGYVFFGSASPLADRVKESFDGPARPDCLLLDFAAVSGFDYSAVNVLSRLLLAANRADIHVVLSAPPKPFLDGLARNLPPAVFAELAVEADADLALERCEEAVIESWKASASRDDAERASLLQQAGDALERLLERQIDFEELMEELGGWLDRREYSSGETIAGDRIGGEMVAGETGAAETKAGDAKMPAGETLAGEAKTPAGMQLLIAGRASAYDAAGARLYQCAPGDAVRPTGALAEKVAAVVADKPCRTVVLTPDTRRWLEANRPDLALRLYRYLLADGFRDQRGDVQDQDALPDTD